MRWSTSVAGDRVLRLPAGLQIRQRDIRVALALIGVLAALVLLALGTGSISVPLDVFWGGALSPDQHYALYDIRIPRIVVGFTAGYSVALSGAILQSVTRNALADPGVLGLSQGAIVSVMLVLVLAPSAPQWQVFLCALAGGCGVALVLFMLTGRERGNSLALLLMGIAVESVLSSVSGVLLLYMPPEVSQSLSEWMLGTLFQASPRNMFWMLPLFLACFVGVLWAGPPTRALELGDELAQSIGEEVGRSRPRLLLFAVVCNTAAVAVVGPLTLLGVMAPHLVAFMAAAGARARLYLSALTGGVMVVLADTVLRGIAHDRGLPIGVIIILTGVPLAVILMRRHHVA